MRWDFGKVNICKKPLNRGICRLGGFFVWIFSKMLIFQDLTLLGSQRRNNPDEIIGMETVLDQVEINCIRAGQFLKENW